MLIQSAAGKSKSRLPLLIVLGLLFLGTGFVIFRTYFSQADIDLTPADVSLPSSRFNTSFDTKVLDDSRVKGLRMHGVAEVQVQERGQKPNPFQPF